MLLYSADHAGFHQFQHHKEGYDLVHPALLILQKFPKAQLAVGSDVIRHIPRLLIDIHLFLFNPAETAADRIHFILLPLQAGFKNLIQTGQRQIAQQFLIVHRFPIRRHLIRQGWAFIEHLLRVHLHVL